MRYLKQKQPKTCVWILTVGGKEFCKGLKLRSAAATSVMALITCIFSITPAFAALFSCLAIWFRLFPMPDKILATSGGNLLLTFRLLGCSMPNAISRTQRASSARVFFRLSSFSSCDFKTRLKN